MLSYKLTLPLPMGFGSFLFPFLWDSTRLGMRTSHVQPQNLPGLQAILYLVIAVCGLVAAASLHLSISLRAIEHLLQHPAPQLLVPKLLSKQQIRHYYDPNTRSLRFMLWLSGRSTRHCPLTISHSQQRCPTFTAQDYHDLLVVTITQSTKDKLEFNSLPAGSRPLPWKSSSGLMLLTSVIKDADFCVKPYQYQMGRTHTTSRPQRLC